MALNLEKLVSSEPTYDRQIKDALSALQKEKELESTLKKIILFCKNAFSVNYAQRKKYLCLMLIKDISETIKSPYFDKTLDDNIPLKLLKIISNQMATKPKDAPHIDEEEQYSPKLLKFAIQTIHFWTKKLAYMPGKSQFSDTHDELKRLKVPLTKNYEFYKSQKIVLGLWGDKEQNTEQEVKNEEKSPLIRELEERFFECKALIEEKINEAVTNEEEIYLKPLTEKLREFLLAFFGKYKPLEMETTLDRDVLVVYFHISIALFKRVSNRFYIPYPEMISLTKEVFEANYANDFASIDRMDLISLAGIHKYNALTIFQRIHSRIEQQEAKMGPCELTFEQKEAQPSPEQKASPKKMDSQPKFKR